MNPRQAEQLQLDLFRRMTPEQRVDCALRWTALTLEFARAGVRSQNPHWTPEQIEREVGRRITGIDVTKLDWERATAEYHAACERLAMRGEARVAEKGNE